jgi:hypothetical protein
VKPARLRHVSSRREKTIPMGLENSHHSPFFFDIVFGPSFSFLALLFQTEPETSSQFISGTGLTERTLLSFEITANCAPFLHQHDRQVAIHLPKSCWRASRPLCTSRNRRAYFRGARQSGGLIGCLSIAARIVIATAVIALSVASPPALAQEWVPSESRSKATFLATFPSFVDWPAGAFSSAHAALVVCVLGDFRFGTTLAEMSRDASPHGRRVEVRWIRKEQEFHSCHILFVSASEAPRYARLIAIVRDSDIFTVGETPDFLAAGGMLSISFEKEALQFEVNLGPANEAHFHVSSRLLALARRVVNQPEQAKN